MIVQCPSCRELAQVSEAHLDDEGRRAGLACSACGAVAWLPLATASLPVQERSSAEGSRQGSLPSPAPAPAAEPSAAHAGGGSGGGSGESSEELPEERQATLRAALESVSLEGDAARPLAEGLLALVPRWDDFPGHRALIQRAHALDASPILGVRYRKVLEVVPDDPTATRATKEILTLAMASLSTLSSAPDQDARRRTQVVMAAALALLLLLGSVGLLLFVLRGL